MFRCFRCVDLTSMPFVTLSVFTKDVDFMAHFGVSNWDLHWFQMVADYYEFQTELERRKAKQFSRRSPRSTNGLSNGNDHVESGTTVLHANVCNNHQQPNRIILKRSTNSRDFFFSSQMCFVVFFRWKRLRVQYAPDNLWIFWPNSPDLSTRFRSFLWAPGKVTFKVMKRILSKP